MKHHWLFYLIGLGLFFSISCTTGLKKDISSLREELSGLRNDISAMEKKLKIVDNEIFVVKDRLASNQVVMQNPKNLLPIIKLTPPSSDEIEVVIPQKSPLIRKGLVPKRTSVTQPLGPKKEEDASKFYKSFEFDSKKISFETDPVSLYRQGRTFFVERKYEKAQLVFAQFLKLYPNHELADNSLYWMGEGYYGKSEYAQAVRCFKRILTEYSTGDKVPDAILKIALSYKNLGNAKNYAMLLKSVVKLYPLSDAAKIAKVRLQEE